MKSQKHAKARPLFEHTRHVCKFKFVYTNVYLVQNPYRASVKQVSVDFEDFGAKARFHYI